MSETFLETIRAIDGKIFHLNYHQKRYESVLNSLGCSNFKELKDYIKPPHVGKFRCRIVYNKETLHVEYIEYKKRDINSLKLIYNDDIEYSRKSTCRDEIDKLFTCRENCDDILIVKNNYITDTSIANIALYKDGLWFTPLEPLLQGTTRQRLIDEVKIIEKMIKVDELSEYSQVALLNAMIDFDIIPQYNLKDFFVR